MDEKTCGRCRETKPLTAFQNDASRRDGKSPRCRACRAAYRRTPKGSAAKQRDNAVQRGRRADWWLAYRQDHPCVCCGETDVSALHLHHRVPATKVKAVSRMIYDMWAWDRIHGEIEKCVVLCHHCHPKVHHGSLSI